MRLADILSPDRVSVRFEADDKTDALRGIARLFANGVPGLAAEQVYTVLAARETLASTGVGSQVAIPHGRMAGLAGMRGVVALSHRGVPFDALDGEPVKIFVGVLGPDAHTGEHLKALARVSRLLRDERVRERLLRAETSDAAFEIIVQEDERH